MRHRQNALEDLIEFAQEHTPVIMCAEAVYWRCHQRIIADWLIVADYDVIDIFDSDRANKHDLTRFAGIPDGDVIYPAADDGS